MQEHLKYCMQRGWCDRGTTLQRRYTDDLLLKAIPEKGIIQIRSESRVGIGDNGVNQKRVDAFAYRLKTEQDISS